MILTSKKNEKERTDTPFHTSHLGEIQCFLYYPEVYIKWSDLFSQDKQVHYEEQLSIQHTLSFRH